jgi:hypothetical protein
MKLVRNYYFGPIVEDCLNNAQLSWRKMQASSNALPRIFRKDAAAQLFGRLWRAFTARAIT